MKRVPSTVFFAQSPNWKAILFVSFYSLSQTMVGCQPVADLSSGPASTKSASSKSTIKVTSTAFGPGELCPVDFTSDGIGVSPPIEWSGAPDGTKSFAINLYRVNVDKNAESSWTSSYWVLYNIPSDVTHLEKGEKAIGIEGLNDRSKRGYDPLNAKQRGINDYHITVYALSQMLEFETDKITRRAMLDAIDDVTLASGTLDFRYEHAKRTHIR